MNKKLTNKFTRKFYTVMLFQVKKCIHCIDITLMKEKQVYFLVHIARLQ